MNNLTKEDTKPVLDNNGNVVEFTIVRSKWGKGRLLYDDKTKGCCMGHYGFACGVEAKHLNHFSHLLPEYRPKWLDTAFNPSDYGISFKGIDTLTMESVRNTLAHINDNSTMSREQKEDYITKIFAHHGIKVNFV